MRAGSFPRAFTRLTGLTKLAFNTTDMEGLPRALKHLPSLKSLSITSDHHGWGEEERDQDLLREFESAQTLRGLSHRVLSVQRVRRCGTAQEGREDAHPLLSRVDPCGAGQTSALPPTQARHPPPRSGFGGCGVARHPGRFFYAFPCFGESLALGKPPGTPPRHTFHSVLPRAFVFGPKQTGGCPPRGQGADLSHPPRLVWEPSLGVAKSRLFCPSAQLVCL